MRPTRSATHDATTEPSTEPTASVVSSTPYPGSDSFRVESGPTAHSTNSENAAVHARFETPTIAASVRSTGRFHKNRSPSATSVRSEVLTVRSTRNTPRSASSTSTATTHKPAGAPNASATPAAATTPPRGGPTNEFIVSSTAISRPFALCRSSRGTIIGRIDWAVVS